MMVTHSLVRTWSRERGV